ncbi:MAG: hypothetical protein ACR2JZ_04030, partial [Candidatus Limnocylindrales bacterium]
TDVELRQGYARFVAARESVRLEQSGAITVLANRVEMNPQSGTVFLFAREVTGTVRTLFDWRSGLAFGIGIGVVSAVARLAGASRRR